MEPLCRIQITSQYLNQPCRFISLSIETKISDQEHLTKRIKEKVEKCQMGFYFFRRKSNLLAQLQMSRPITNIKPKYQNPSSVSLLAKCSAYITNRDLTSRIHGQLILEKQVYLYMTISFYVCLFIYDFQTVFSELDIWLCSI